MGPFKCTYAEEGCAVTCKRQDKKAHEIDCPHKPVACVYSSHGCKFTGKRTGTKTHEIDCPHRPVVCGYSISGCTFTGKRPDTNAHEIDCPYGTQVLLTINVPPFCLSRGALHELKVQMKEESKRYRMLLMRQVTTVDLRS
jgi:hypothetical protein